MDEKNILVVEDEYGAAEMLQLMLELEGYRVTTAGNGREAMECVARHRPDLVLCDFMMPLVNGAQFGRMLRAAPATADIPIVMMSGIAESDVRRHFDGYDAFLQKPFLIDDVLAVLRTVLAPRTGEGQQSAFSWVDALGRLLLGPKPAG